MRSLRLGVVFAVALSPLVGLCAGCDQGSANVPLAKVATPPPLPLQDKSKLKPAKGHSPDVLPGGN